MKSLLLFALLFQASLLSAQTTTAISPFEARNWGVVLQYPEMKNVKCKSDIIYLKSDSTTLHIDIYTPPKLKKEQKIPAIVFLNVASITPGRTSVKSNEGNTTWAKLVASQGFIGITIEVNNDVEASFDSIFDFLDEKGAQYNIDAHRLGVWAASANTIIAGNYLMKEKLYPGIKAAVLYYGFFPTAPINKNLPILFIVAEGDIERNQYQTIWPEIIKTKAPWTIKMASNLPHAFDIFTDNDKSRIMIKETISFWKNYLEPVEQPLFKKEIEREVMAAMYWHDDKKIISLMKDWFQNNSASRDLLAYSLYARALANNANYTEAEAIYKKQQEIDPSNQTLLLDLAVASFAADKPEAAEKYLADYAKKTALQRSNYIYIATALRQLKKYKYAVQYYEKALAIEARPFTYYLIGVCNAQINEKDKAFEALNKAADLGYNKKSDFENDADLTSLKQDARWKLLLEKLK
jgi:tetratricopeptide (TPR) repeat protein